MFHEVAPQRHTIARAGAYHLAMAELGGGSYEDAEDAGFFAVLPSPPALAGGLTLLGEAAAIARQLPKGLDQSAVIEAIIGQVERGATEAAVATAKVSEEQIIERIHQTRVRPISGTEDRKRLEDGIRSEVLTLGAVGVASIEALDSVVGTDGKPFWRAQEYGSSHNVGRVVIGLFQPGNSLPDQQLFRQHGAFVPGPGGAMHIQRPIPARHFLRDGTAAAALFRERQFGELEGVAVTDIRGVRAVLL